MEIQKRKGRKPKLVKRTREQYERDLAVESDFFLKGYTYRAIADYINRQAEERGEDYRISHVSVFKDMQECLIQWKREQLQNIDDYVTRELRQLDKMEWELWGQWERSKEGKTRLKTRNDKKPLKVLDEREEERYHYGYSEETKEHTLGDPRYMDLLLNVQQRRAKLLGYDAPIKFQDMTPPRESELTEKYNLTVIPKELLFAVVDKLQDAKVTIETSNKDAA